ncbi:MAG: hypothetical protein P8125_03015 [Gemmatimonadota bacterium]
MSRLNSIRFTAVSSVQPPARSKVSMADSESSWNITSAPVVRVPIGRAT